MAQPPIYKCLACKLNRAHHQARSSPVYICSFRVTSFRLQPESQTGTQCKSWRPWSPSSYRRGTRSTSQCRSHLCICRSRMRCNYSDDLRTRHCRHKRMKQRSPYMRSANTASKAQNLRNPCMCQVRKPYTRGRRRIAFRLIQEVHMALCNREDMYNRECW